ELSEGRDPALLRTLRERALPSLIEMARWKSPGHQHAAFWLLGRIGRLTEAEIDAAWRRRDPERVITAAQKSKSAAQIPLDIRLARQQLGFREAVHDQG